jgi:hypothetical protein
MDEKVALWFRRDLLRFGRFRKPAGREQQAKLEELFDYDDDGAFLDIDPNDEPFILWLIGVVVKAAIGSVYQEAFAKLAFKLRKLCGTSVIDQLAALVEPPPADRVTMEGK